MSGERKMLRAASLKDWSNWLRKNYDKADVIWLVFKKKSKGLVPFDYEMALDEALCWGWVDSLLRTIDEKEYMRKFTPRKPASTWSEHNKRRVKKLIAEGRMREPGLAAIEEGKRTGMWEKIITPPKVDGTIPPSLLGEFQSHPLARDNYFKMPESHRKQYNIWINHAKRPETVRKRVAEAIRLLEKGEELGLR